MGDSKVRITRTLWDTGGLNDLQGLFSDDEIKHYQSKPDVYLFKAVELESGNRLGTALIHVYTGDTARYLDIVGLGSACWTKAAKAFAPMFHALAVHFKCDKVTCMTRREGMSRVLKPYGFEFEYASMVYDVAEANRRMEIAV